MTAAKKTTRPASKPAGKSAGATYEGFTEDERDAMKERARELKSAKGGARAADAEAEVLAKIAEFDEADRVMAERVHAVVMASAPDLTPKLWYGQPAYAREGKVVCFFQPAGKFKTRYSTLGFSDQAHLDDGSMWPTAFALTRLTPVEEARIGELVKQAAS